MVNLKDERSSSELGAEDQAAQGPLPDRDQGGQKAREGEKGPVETMRQDV